MTDDPLLPAEIESALQFLRRQMADGYPCSAADLGNLARLCYLAGQRAREWQDEDSSVKTDGNAE